MPRSFQVPSFYRSQRISLVKQLRKGSDPRKRDFNPSILDFGPVRFKIARHFGFCFGVENAIEIAYRALEENPGRRIFLLSEMIHNPQVNADLEERGVRFLMAPDGTTKVDIETLGADDVVIVPAFGTTVELQNRLAGRGINAYAYDTTCPFVEKVWKRAAELGSAGFSVIIHGKRTHEETRATFSHSRLTAPTLVIFDLADAHFLVDFMKGKVLFADFETRFQGSVSQNFAPTQHLLRVGVVNQTTMLATETQQIANTLRQAMIDIYGEGQLKEHFADTRDTLCYATYENQGATRALMETGADLAIVVGGYNSSNTSHLVELCEHKLPTFYIRDAEEIVDQNTIRHFDLVKREVITTKGWLPFEVGENAPIEIALTAGASCPDATVDEVLLKIVGFFGEARSFEEVVERLS